MPPLVKSSLEVIDDVVRAHVTQHVQFAGLVDHGHLNVVELGHLQGERTNAPACPVQEQLLAGLNLAHIDEALHRQHTRLRDGGGLLEGHSGRFVREARFRRTGIFRKCAETAPAQIAVDLITRLERFDISAHGFNTPSDITANDLHLRCEEAVKHATYERALQQLPVPIR